MTPAGFFHCSFPNLINCPHNSSYFSSFSISSLPFSDPSLTPSQEMWLTYSSLEHPDHSTDHFINNPTYSHSSVGKESACNAGESGRSAGEGICYPLRYSWASLVVQLVKNCLQCRRPQSDSWVGKIPWRREKVPTPVFRLENTTRGIIGVGSRTQLSDFHFHFPLTLLIQDSPSIPLTVIHQPPAPSLSFTMPCSLFSFLVHFLSF